MMTSGVQVLSVSNGDAFVRRLETFGSLPDADKELIRTVSTHTRRFAASTDIIREGDQPGEVNLIIQGFAYRYKLLPQASRQIVAYLMPGDICDLHASLLDVMDHSIAALTKIDLIKLSRDSIERMLERPAIARSLLLMNMANEANGREWIVNIGQRSAERRVAHLICEWHLRLRSIGLASIDECVFPLTQQHIADTAGISVVHTNRVLNDLRRSGLIMLKARQVRIPDIDRLWDMCGFRSNYLHIQGGQRL